MPVEPLRRNVVYRVTTEGGKRYFYVIDAEAAPELGKDWIVTDYEGRADGEVHGLELYRGQTTYYGVCRFVPPPKKSRVYWPKQLAC
jgi:hypothetical protein